MSEPKRFDPTTDCEREKYRCGSCRLLGKRVISEELVKAGKDFPSSGILSDFLASGVQSVVDQSNPLPDLDRCSSMSESVEGCLSRREEVVRVAIELARREITNPHID